MGLTNTEGPTVEGDEQDEADVFRYEISYYPADITIAGYLEKWIANPCQLEVPKFQRRYVWDVKRASRLIESFLLGLPIPQVFLYKERRSNKLLVIDGQQRILSAVKFLEGKFDGKDFRLKGVQSKWEGKTFQELDESDKNQLRDSVLRATVVQQLDPADNTSIYLIFERLNTAGVNLNPMEVRRCLNEGPYLDLLEELNEDANWRAIIGIVSPDKRMKDLEWLLRISALRSEVTHYQKPMKDFLTRHMEKITRETPVKQKRFLTDLKRVFLATTKAVVETYGTTPFHPKRRLNVSVLDACMVAAMAAVKEGKRLSKARFTALMEDPKFVDAVSVSTSDEKVVATRFRLAKTLTR